MTPPMPLWPDAERGLALRRWDFLVGEGTLSVAEVMVWAAELNPNDVRLPHDMRTDTPMMVSVVNKE
jgi:hypothetical protein